MNSGAFDPYEYIAVIAPGAVVALGVVIVWPELKALISNNSFTVGSLGLFVIVSFVLGHLVQGLANILEHMFWAPFGGMPTNWVRSPRQKLLAPAQRERLLQRISAQQGQEIDLVTLATSHWASVTRELYASVSAAGRSKRIDAFNRAYGLMRGVAAGFILLAGILLGKEPTDIVPPLIAAALACLAIYRAFRFARYYGRELLVEFIGLSNESPLPGSHQRQEDGQ